MAPSRKISSSMSSLSTKVLQRPWKMRGSNSKMLQYRWNGSFQLQTKCCKLQRKLTEQPFPCGAVPKLEDLKILKWFVILQKWKVNQCQSPHLNQNINWEGISLGSFFAISRVGYKHQTTSNHQNVSAPELEMSFGSETSRGRYLRLQHSAGRFLVQKNRVGCPVHILRIPTLDHRFPKKKRHFGCARLRQSHKTGLPDVFSASFR